MTLAIFLRDLVRKQKQIKLTDKNPVPGGSYSGMHSGKYIRAFGWQPLVGRRPLQAIYLQSGRKTCLSVRRQDMSSCSRSNRRRACLFNRRTSPLAGQESLFCAKSKHVFRIWLNESTCHLVEQEDASSVRTRLQLNEKARRTLPGPRKK